MHILINAGPTREYFDSVRFISNPSTGKMGFALAREAEKRRHAVTLVAGPVALDDPPGVRVLRVVSAADMLEACVGAFAGCHAAVLTAAVCDYRPANRLDKKLKKKPQGRQVELLPTTDICAHLGSIKETQVVIGFAMEDHNHRRHAEDKLTRKNCDAIVLNGIENVATDAGRIDILSADGTWSGPFTGSKAELAVPIIDFVENQAAG